MGIIASYHHNQVQPKMFDVVLAKHFANDSLYMISVYCAR